MPHGGSAVSCLRMQSKLLVSFVRRSCRPPPAGHFFLRPCQQYGGFSFCLQTRRRRLHPRLATRKYFIGTYGKLIKLF